MWIEPRKRSEAGTREEVLSLALLKPVEPSEQ